MRCRRVCWVCLLRTDVVKNLCALRVQLQPGLCNDGSLLLLLHPPLASGLHHLESRVQEKERRRPACAYQNAAVAQVPGKSAGCGPSTPPSSAVYPGTVICGTFVRKGCVAFRRGRFTYQGEFARTKSLRARFGMVSHDSRIAPPRGRAGHHASSSFGHGSFLQCHR